MWGIVARLAGQMRMCAGAQGAVFTGLDMGGALALTRAAGLPDGLAVEWLAAAETAMLPVLNGETAEWTKEHGDDG